MPRKQKKKAGLFFTARQGIPLERDSLYASVLQQNNRRFTKSVNKLNTGTHTVPHTPNMLLPSGQ
jgi:hypothetical protein